MQELVARFGRPVGCSGDPLMLLAASSTGLHWLDVTVVIAYLIGVTAVGVWVGAQGFGAQ